MGGGCSQNLRGGATPPPLEALCQPPPPQSHYVDRSKSETEGVDHAGYAVWVLDGDFHNVMRSDPPRATVHH